MAVVSGQVRAAITSALWLLALEAGIGIDVFWTMPLGDIAREIWKRRTD